MNRRAFLQVSATAPALAAVSSMAACVVHADIRADASSPVPHRDLEEATIADLAALQARGALTARDLVDAYVARIHAIDRAGPTLRSVIELNPDAPAIADALDAERRARGPRGPLHGIPILLKDNIDTGDRMQTSAGSLALVGAPAPRDAPLVARLREAGAVVLGKTNLSEWANIRSTRSTSGWSARGGLTKNPYVLDRNASGSSSGSAVAVSANLCAAAIGTETDGSIVSPSSICGIVGIKPTVGLVSGAGIVPIARSQDTAGPMARTVTDAAILLGAIAGGDYARALDPAGAHGVRIGVVRALVTDPVAAPTPANLAPSAGRVFDHALDVLRGLGAVVVDGVELKHLSDLDAPELEVLLTELKAGMAAYLAARSSAHRSLEDLVRFHVERASEEMPWFGQELFEKALSKGGLDSPAYATALATCRRIARDEGIDAALAAQSLEVLVAPTGGPAWRTDLVNGDHFTGSASSPAAVAGYPSLTVPCGEVHGLPLGVLFFTRARGEATLLRVGYAFEQAHARARFKPSYRATIEA